MRIPRRLAAFAEDRARLFRIRKWAWQVMTLLAVACYLFARPIWDAVSILYLAVVSNQAMVATNASGEQAAEAVKVAAEGTP